MAEIPSLDIFTYCYVFAWFNCQRVFAYVLGPPPVPSRGRTNNSTLGGKWMATPFPKSLRSNEMKPFDSAPAGGGMLRDDMQDLSRVGAGDTLCLITSASPKRQVFLGLILNVPTPNLITKITVVTIIILSIYGEPCLCNSLILEGPRTHFPVLTPMNFPSSSLGLIPQAGSFP